MSFADTNSTGTLLNNEEFTRSVNALFDSREQAEKARADLLAAGIHAGSVSLVGGDGFQSTGVDQPGGPAPEGFWATLKELFLPEEDRYSFAEGVRRGGFSLSVRTDTANYERVIDLLDRDGAVDLSEREESWRNEGWTGYTAHDPLAAAARTAPAIEPDEKDMSYARPSDATAGFGFSQADRLSFEGTGAPPVESPGALPPSALSASPDLSFKRPDSPSSGSRDLSHGRSRVRSYLRDPEVPSGQA